MFPYKSLGKKTRKKKRKKLLALTTDVARATSKRSHGFVLHPISAFLQRQAPCRSSLPSLSI
ncbi:hypothetical protein V1478_014185 [Vespula squamosa]|uniref:Uncharacterized protein n=1 Tax=Vespula squamosa TaxID=30214 RepID=A0ABD2A7B5_VESSQ